MNSNELFERALRVIPGGVNSPVRAFRSVGGTPFFTERADRCFLYTCDQKRLIDYVCTWGPAIHGHNDPDIREALEEALARGTSYGTPGPLEVDMAETVSQAVPSIEKVRMCNSGTEATLSSIRLARGATQRDKIIKFTGCYHGHVDALLVEAGSGALTLGKPNSAGIPESVTKDTIVCQYNDIGSVEAAFSQYPEDIAAIIVEPYPANCGLILPVNHFLSSLRTLCDQHGTLLIFDEVMTGFRLAYGGVQELENVIPDITALGKIIGGGLPVGAFGGKKEIMQHLAPEGAVYQAGTLSGNPLAMAAGLASLRKLQGENPYRKLEEAGRLLKEALQKVAHSVGYPVCLHQTGSMFCLFFGIEKVTTFKDVQKSDADKFATWFHKSIERGIYLPPSAYETCFISTAHLANDFTAIHQTIEILSHTLKDTIAG